jgi:hypothetical protein
MSEQCYWCGSSDGETKTITVETINPIATSTQEETLTVHPEHESELRAFNEKTVAYGSRFLILAILFGAVLPTIGAALLPVVGKAVGLGIVGGSILLLSAVFYVYPFATPETVDMLGVKTSVRLVRVLAIGIVVPLGLWIVWLGLS